MSWIEIFIVYLAVGASFGAHYFSTQRRNFLSPAVWLNSLGVTFCWLIYAGGLFYQSPNLFKTINKRFFQDASREERINILSRNLQTAFVTLIAKEQSLSFFEFRENLERYIGLTLALERSTVDGFAAKHEQEIFRIADRENKDLRLAAQCFHRKNYLRLQIHQARSRDDLSRIFKKLNEFFVCSQNDLKAAWQKFESDALLLSEILKDAEATSKFQRSFVLAQANPNIAGTSDEAEKLDAQSLLLTSFPALPSTTACAQLRIMQD